MPFLLALTGGGEQVVVPLLAAAPKNDKLLLWWGKGALGKFFWHLVLEIAALKSAITYSTTLFILALTGGVGSFSSTPASVAEKYPIAAVVRQGGLG